MKKSILFLLCFAAMLFAYENADSSSNDTASESGGVTESENVPEGGGPISGGRSRENIQQVVAQNVGDLRRTYSVRLLEIPDAGGIVTIRFAINEFGKVIFAHVVQSTTYDPMFDNIIMTLVRSWDFGPNHKPGDITEVTYPFAFSP